MSYPDLSVEVAFVSDPLDTTPTYTDITDLTFAVSTEIGRAAQFDSFEPGTASLTLDNTDRTFDPLHGSGPHFGDLLPNKRVRISATYEATTYELFNGHVDGWPQSYSEPGTSESQVTATDAFKLLSRTRLPVDDYASAILQDSPRLWYRMSETSGKKLVDSSGNGRDAVTSEDMSLAASDGLMASSHDGGVEMGLQWDARISADHLAFDFDPCSIEFWFQCDKPPTEFPGYVVYSNGPDIAVNVIIVDVATAAGSRAGYIWFILSSAPGLRYVFAPGNICDNRPHHIVCTRSGSTTQVYIDGVLSSTTPVSSGSMASSVGQPLVLNGGENEVYDKWEGTSGAPHMDEFAIYDTVLSADRIRAHHDAGDLLWDGDRTGERVAHVLDLCDWPSALRDVDDGQTHLGPALWDDGSSVLEYLRLVEATEQGQLFVDHANGGVVRFRSRSTVLNDVRTTNRQAWFSDNDGDAGFVVRYVGLDASYDETKLVNTVNVEWVGGTVTAADQTSIDAMGEMGRTISTLMTSKADAEALASWVLNHGKDAFLRIEAIEVNPVAQSGLSAELAWEAVLGLRIGDRVLVDRTPQDVGVAISQEVLIEGISHDISGGQGEWITTFRCGPAEAVDYWILGTSELADDTRLAF